MIRIQPKQITLLNNDDIFRIEAKVVILGEEGFRLAAGWTAGHQTHHIPRDDNKTLFISRLILCDRLETFDTLSLVLEEGLVRGKTDIVAAFRGGATEPRALTPSHQKDANLAMSNGLETDLLPLPRPGRIGGRELARAGGENFKFDGIGSITFRGGGPFVNPIYSLYVDTLKLAGESCASSSASFDQKVRRWPW